MALKRKWKGENIDPSFSSASFKTNFTVKKLRSMPSHFPTLIPFGHTMFKRCYWFLKSTWCAKSNLKFAKQIIVVRYLCNEVRVDSSSWSSVTYVSHSFTACIIRNRVIICCKCAFWILIWSHLESSLFCFFWK